MTFEALDERIVPNAAPVIQYDMTNYSVHTGQSMTWTPVVTDDDGDPITLHAAAQTEHGGTVTIDGGAITYTAPNAWTGFDPVDFWADDGQGGVGAEQKIIYSTNSAPVVPSNYDVYAHAGSTVSLQVQLTYYYTVDGDGDPVSIIGVQSDSGTGVVDSMSPDTLVLTPNPGVTGDATYTFTVGDGHGGTGTGTVYLHYLNSPPTANTLALNAHAGSTVVVAPSLLGDDPDGDPVTVTNVGTTFHGTTGYDPTVGLSYTPDDGFTGEESFAFTMADPFGGTATGSVTVAYSNAAPTGQDFARTTLQGVAISGNLLDGATDPDGDALSATVASGVTAGAFAVQTDGSYTFTPAAGFLGTETIQFAVLDGVGGVTVRTFSVTVFDGVSDSYTTDEDTPFVSDHSLLANDLGGGDPVSALSVGLVSSPDHGQLRLNPDGFFTYVPNENWSGTDSFTYVASDGMTFTSPTTITITVDPVNDAPVAATSFGAYDDYQPSSILATDATDAEGDSLTFAVVSAQNGTAVANADGTITYTPDVTEWSGYRRIVYTVSDGHGGTDAGTILAFCSKVNVNKLNELYGDIDGLVDRFQANFSLVDDEDDDSDLASILDDIHKKGTAVGNATDFPTYAWRDFQLSRAISKLERYWQAIQWELSNTDVEGVKHGILDKGIEAAALMEGDPFRVRGLDDLYRQVRIFAEDLTDRIDTELDYFYHTVSPKVAQNQGGWLVQSLFDFGVEVQLESYRNKFRSVESITPYGYYVGDVVTDPVLLDPDNADLLDDFYELRDIGANCRVNSAIINSSAANAYTITLDAAERMWGSAQNIEDENARSRYSLAALDFAANVGQVVSLMNGFASDLEDADELRDNLQVGHGFADEFRDRGIASFASNAEVNLSAIITAVNGTVTALEGVPFGSAYHNFAVTQVIGLNGDLANLNAERLRFVGVLGV